MKPAHYETELEILGMSERQRAVEVLVRTIREAKWSDGSPIYDAPYGVIAGLKRWPGGGCTRTITFGVRRRLDAVAYVWTPDKVSIYGRGPLGNRLDGHHTFIDAEKLIRTMGGATNADT